MNNNTSIAEEVAAEIQLAASKELDKLSKRREAVDEVEQLLRG